MNNFVDVELLASEALLPVVVQSQIAILTVIVPLTATAEKSIENLARGKTQSFPIEKRREQILDILPVYLFPGEYIGSQALHANTVETLPQVRNHHASCKNGRLQVVRQLLALLSLSVYLSFIADFIPSTVYQLLWR